jgi:hypothetical protein
MGFSHACRFVTRRAGALAAVPMIVIAALAPGANGVANAAVPDRLTLHDAAGDIDSIEISSVKLTGSQLVVTLTQSASSLQLFDLGAQAQRIPTIIVDSQGCQQQFGNALVTGIAWQTGGTTATSVTFNATASGAPTCLPGSSLSTWNQVTNSAPPTGP